MGLLTTLPLVLVVGALVVALVLALAACWLLYQRYARLKRERAREAARARLQGELAAAWAACQASLTGFDTLAANIRRKSSEAAKRNLADKARRTALLEASLDEVSVKLRGRRFESPASGAAGFRPRRRGTPGSGGILTSTSGFAGTPGASNHSPGD